MKQQKILEANNEIRRCKKCGCELMSTNKRKLCEHCRRERAETIKTGVKAVGVAVVGGLMFLARGKFGGSDKS